MPDTTITTTQNASYRRPIPKNTPYTIQIDPLNYQYLTPDRPVKIILHTGGPLFVRAGNTCVIDDPMADIVGTGQFINTTPLRETHTITVIADTDTTVSFIRRP